MNYLPIPWIQRIHGSVLVLLGSGLAVVSLYSQRTGWGVYGFLQEQPMGVVGLLQAYLLMVIIGIVLCIGAASKCPSKVWNLIGLVAHFPPLLALALYGYLFLELGIGYIIGVSIAIHATWIIVELTSLFFGKIKPSV